MAVNTAATLVNILKEMYEGQGVQDLAYNEKARPFLKRVTKKNHYGKYFPVPVKYGQNVGAGADFATTQANIGVVPDVEFLVTTVKDYSLARIDTEGMLLSSSNEGAFIDAVEYVVNACIEEASNRLEAAAFGDRSGRVGTISSGYAGTTITLTSVSDSVNIEVGAKLVTSATTTGALTSAAARTVTAIDRDAGTFTINAAFAGTTADGDLLFNEADRVSAAYNQRVAGHLSWIPATAPTSGDSYFGIDRSTDPQRLAGVRHTGSAGNIEGSIIQAAHKVARAQGNPDVCWMSFTNHGKLVEELRAKDQGSSNVSTGFGGKENLKIWGPKGVIECIPGTFVSDSYLHLDTMDSWEFRGAGARELVDFIRLPGEKGIKLYEVSNADAREVRVGSYAQLVCLRPAHNATISL